MKKSLFAVFMFLWALQVHATPPPGPYHTISINGVTDGWSPTETFTNVSGPNITGAYFTWDATHLYFGISGQEAGYNFVTTFMYFDTDLSENSGTYDGYAWGNNLRTPFKADFAVVWRNEFSENYIEVRHWNGTAWVQIAAVNGTALGSDVVFAINQGNKTREVAISRAVLGNPASIRVCSFTEQQWNNWRFMAWPSNGWPGDNFRAAGQYMNYYYEYPLVDGIVTPNSPTNLKAIDYDGDGSPFGTDCNDNDNTMYPGNTEVCDGKDNNCDTSIDEGVKTTYYKDEDSDGYGNPAISSDACSAPAGYIADNKDCDDAEATVHPEAPESCNGIDDNCDGTADNGLTAPNADNQNGVCSGAKKVCGDVMGWLEPNYSAITGYEATEASCDGKDNDCDASIDEGVKTTYYKDEDSDGYGNPVISSDACSAPAGYVADNKDCDDAAATVHPGATESCNGIDDNCDGTADNGLTAPNSDNQNGVCSGAKKVCDGVNGWKEPNYGLIAGYEATEASCDAKDNDCDASIDEGVKTTYYKDEDGDGYGNPAISSDACSAPEGYVADNKDCDDTSNKMFPNNPEICDGLDNNCDAQADNGLTEPNADNQNGVCSGAKKVCAGVAGWVEPNYSAIAGYETTEVTCDGKDNDCSGAVDNGLTAPNADKQFGVCQGQKKECNGSNGWQEPDYTALLDYEATEARCDAKDNDCDESVDEGVKTTFYFDKDDDGYGNPQVTEQACSAPNGYSPHGTDCDDENDKKYPSNTEVCDGLDNNCDLQDDNGLTAPLADNQKGICENAKKVCSGVMGWSEPNYSAIADYETTESLCDGKDNDCSGAVDNGLTAPEADKHVGVCAGQIKSCDGVNGWKNPDYTLIVSYEASENTCDNKDNDCDGSTDNGLSAPNAEKQLGVCAGTKKVCSGEEGWKEPDYTTVANYAATEQCDGKDNDCDGTVPVNEADEDGDTVLACADKCVGFKDSEDQDSDGTPNGCDTDYPGTCTNPIAANANFTANGDTSGRTAIFTAYGDHCGGTDQPNTEMVYSVAVKSGDTVKATVTPSAAYDAALRLLTVCQAAHDCVTAADMGGAGTAESAEYTATADGTVYVVVEGVGTKEEGAYSIEITVESPVVPDDVTTDSVVTPDEDTTVTTDSETPDEVASDNLVTDEILTDETATDETVTDTTTTDKDATVADKDSAKPDKDAVVVSDDEVADAVVNDTTITDSALPDSLIADTDTVSTSVAEGCSCALLF